MAELPLVIYQAVGTSWTIASSIHRLVGAYREAPACMAQADRQCAAVRGQLACLQSLMLNETWSRRAERSRIDFGYFVAVVVECAERLAEFEETLNKVGRRLEAGDHPHHHGGGRKMGPEQMFKYRWMKTDIERLASQLQVSRDSIAPILEVLQT